MQTGSFTFPVGMDQEGDVNHGVTKRYGINMVPVLIVVNSEGVITYREAQFNETTIRSVINKLGIK